VHSIYKPTIYLASIYTVNLEAYLGNSHINIKLRTKIVLKVYFHASY